MSLRFVSSLNSPPFVAAAGVAVIAGLPFAEAAAASGASLALLKGLNLAAFAGNCAAVSVPGRIDEQQDVAMRKGALDPSKPGAPTESTGLNDATTGGGEYTEIYSPSRGRSLVSPSGWAFAIWGPIYLGEAAFVGGQFLSDALAGVLPQVAPAFIAANIMQSLWCASFRPSYSEGWKKYVSVGCLAGTALSLLQINAFAGSAEAASLGWYFLPLSLHAGWTTAATLVNLNGSVAMNENIGERSIIAVGHGSAITATALGVGITIMQATPAYGLTVAWALAAVADGMSKRMGSLPADGPLQQGANIQKTLCWIGSAACAAASISTFF
uniref:Uncharacterized protein n=1 Tax=Minutocellus polymorphus TaxID=265543 RepID=A0A7S0AJR6_9STRA|mmetsp:Transcript_15727/g.26177  ORF Transcript_15727/g.26177 Transcript_15727/m.26177 type:complete len:327 (+) Transcript_15727:48-1028(+)